MNTKFTSPVEQEIWTTIRAINDAWTGGHPEDLINFFHPQMIAVTPVDRLRREGAEECVAGWKAFADAASINRWQESSPLIRVYGHAAVVAYYYEIEFEMNGQHFAEGGRDLFFLIYENSRWLVVGDQFSCNP